MLDVMLVSLCYKNAPLQPKQDRWCHNRKDPDSVTSSSHVFRQ